MVLHWLIPAVTAGTSHPASGMSALQPGPKRDRWC